MERHFLLVLALRYCYNIHVQKIQMTYFSVQPKWPGSLKETITHTVQHLSILEIFLNSSAFSKYLT